MIFVLLPFWTSLLVRTVSWIVILMQNGIFNNILVWAGIVSDDNRIQLIYNETGTLIAMTQILLPFMVLPLYSVMKTIPPSYMRAALNLGAQPMHAFYRIYMPQTVPGISAGWLTRFCSCHWIFYYTRACWRFRWTVNRTLDCLSSKIIFKLGLMFCTRNDTVSSNAGSVLGL